MITGAAATNRRPRLFSGDLRVGRAAPNGIDRTAKAALYPVGFLQRTLTDRASATRVGEPPNRQALGKSGYHALCADDEELIRQADYFEVTLNEGYTIVS